MLSVLLYLKQQNHDLNNPKGGLATPFEHNRGNNNSVYTSWTVSPWVANSFATNQGKTDNGVVLIKRFHISETTPSPDFMNQGEVLIKGIVKGALPLPSIKN